MLVRSHQWILPPLLSSLQHFLYFHILPGTAIFKRVTIRYILPIIQRGVIQTISQQWRPGSMMFWVASASHLHFSSTPISIHLSFSVLFRSRPNKQRYSNRTPALATSQPQCEFPEAISTPSHIIIHTADEGGKYCFANYCTVAKISGEFANMGKWNKWQVVSNFHA